MTKRLPILLALLVLTGCATKTPIKTSPADSRVLNAEVKSTLGIHTGIMKLEVTSHGWLSDMSFRTMSRLRGSSDVAKQLAESLSFLHGQNETVMLYGPNSHKTVRVAIDALTLLKKRHMSHLTLIFAGTESDFKRLQKKVPFFGGRLLFIQQPG